MLIEKEKEPKPLKRQSAVPRYFSSGILSVREPGLISSLLNVGSIGQLPCPRGLPTVGCVLLFPCFPSTSVFNLCHCGLLTNLTVHLTPMKHIYKMSVCLPEHLLQSVFHRLHREISPDCHLYRIQEHIMLVSRNCLPEKKWLTGDLNSSVSSLFFSFPPTTSSRKILCKLTCVFFSCH